MTNNEVEQKGRHHAYKNHVFSPDVILSDENSVNNQNTATAEAEKSGSLDKSSTKMIAKSVLGVINGSLGFDQYFKRKAQKNKLQKLNLEQLSSGSNSERPDLLTAATVAARKPLSRKRFNMHEQIKASGPILSK